MVHSHSDSESEDQLKDPLDGDREVLREEDEREKLLTASNGDASRKARRRSRRCEKRRQRKGHKDEDGTELYNIEEGGKDEVGYTSSRSSMENSRERETAALRTRVCMYGSIFGAISGTNVAIAVTYQGSTYHSGLCYYSHGLVFVSPWGNADVGEAWSKRKEDHNYLV